MNAYRLRAAYEAADPQGHFFDRDTMRFFGDTMANYGVRALRSLNSYCLYRKRPVRDPDGVSKVTLFDIVTLQPTTISVDELNALVNTKGLSHV